MARDARATNKDAARKLQEAADGIRDRKLRDKIRYSKGVVKSGAADQGGGGSRPKSARTSTSCRAR